MNLVIVILSVMSLAGFSNAKECSQYVTFSDPDFGDYNVKANKTVCVGDTACGKASISFEYKGDQTKVEFGLCVDQENCDSDIQAKCDVYGMGLQAAFQALGVSLDTKLDCSLTCSSMKLTSMFAVVIMAFVTAVRNIM